MRGDFSVPGYEVEGLLSAGASGEVWLARSLATREQVALKRIAVGPETHETARRLVEMLGELAHQHLVQVRDLVAQDDEVVLIMTYPDGGSLAQLLLARGTLDPGEVVTTVAPLAEALGAVHHRGFVHGDITPESIHYTAQGFPLLGDVGVLSLNELDASNAGTHGYTDPLAPGEGRLSPPGDVYSLAAVCYALLTGDPPPPPHERRPLHELAPGVPPGLAHAVEAGLQGDPARRPSAGQFAELLYGAGQPAPVRFPLGLVITGSDPFGQGGSGQSGGTSGGPQPTLPMQPTQFAQPSQPTGGPEQAPPVLGGGAAPTSWRPVEDDDEPEGRGRGVLIGALVGVSVLLVAAVIGGIVWLNVGGEPDPDPTKTVSQPTGDPGDPTDEPTDQPTDETQGPTVDDLETIPPSPPDDPELRRWWDVLTELDTARSEAFAQADPDLLNNVYTADAKVLQGSLPEGNDRLQVEGFAEAGGAAEGVLFYIESVRIENASSNEAVLEVVDQLQPHILVHPDGTREEQPAGSLTARRITLHRVGADEWRIYDIQRGNG